MRTAFGPLRKMGNLLHRRFRRVSAACYNQPVSEREKLQQRARELAAGRHAERQETERRLAEYQQRRKVATSSLRERLEALKREYAGTIALSVSGSHTSIHVSISGKSTAFQKPFASISIRPDGDGFYSPFDENNLDHCHGSENRCSLS
jgi:hypothetical protein